MRSLTTFLGTLGIALFATPSEAQITTLTVSGKISDGKICTSVANCIDLAGQVYSVTYMIDPSVGTRFTSGSDDLLRGGTTVLGNPPSPVTAVAHIAGMTFTSTGAYLGYAETQSAPGNGTGYDLQFYRSEDNVVTNNGNLTYLHRKQFTSEVFYTASGATPHILDPISGIALSSLGQIFSYDYDLDRSTGAYSNYLYLLANTSVETAVFNAVPVSGAVPEPASWSLLIVGMGFVGAALRRARAIAVASYSNATSVPVTTCGEEI